MGKGGREKQKMKAKEKEKRNKKKTAEELSFFEISRRGMAGDPKKDPAQSCIPILEWYENGILHIAEDPETKKKSGGKETELYCIVCSFSSSGYLSGTEAEKGRKYFAYKEALSSLPTYLHYEELVSNRPVDKQTYLDAVAAGPESSTDPFGRRFFLGAAKIRGRNRPGDFSEALFACAFHFRRRAATFP